MAHRHVGPSVAWIGAAPQQPQAVPTQTRRALLLLLAGCLACSAPNGDRSSSTSTSLAFQALSKQEYIEKADALCAAQSTSINRANDGNLPPPEIAEQDPQGAAPYVEARLRADQELRDGLINVEPPSEVAELIDRFTIRLTEQVELWRAALEAAEQGQGDTYSHMMAAVNWLNFQGGGGPLGEELRAYGLRVCGADPLQG